LARRTGSRPDQVVLGNGAAELLWTLAAAILSPGDAALVVEPAFSEFAAAARQRGARVSEWRATWECGFAVRLDAVAEAIERSRARAVYLCSPGNPAGVHTPLAGIAALARRFPDVVFVLDQAFLGLSEHHGELDAVPPENVVRVRSLTKDHGIPGIRVGYLLATVELAARVERARPPWTTSTAAQAAAIAACGAEDFVAASRERLLALRARLGDRLAGLGLPVAPSCTVYCLVRTGMARVGDSAALKERLFTRHGILTRDCTSFGLPGWLRLAARPEPEQERLIEALRREMER
jgi:histidinol-phosphate/aromatic aminotransferase/cobyric acid decarboxylase-like protein